MMKPGLCGLVLWVLAFGGMPVMAADRLPPRDLQQKVTTPYRIEVTPPQAGLDSAVIRVKPMPAMPLAIADKTCALSIRPTSGTPGTAWQGQPDPTCSREESLRLPIGLYTIHLAILWRPSGSTTGRNDTQDLPYEVRAGDRLRVLSLRRDTTQPATNTAGKYTFAIENVGLVPINGVWVRGWLHGPSGAQLLIERRIGGIRPGEVVNDAMQYIPVSPGPSRVSVEVDSENVAGEVGDFRNNNKMQQEFAVAPGPPPKPILVPGAITTQRSAARSTWVLEFTVCNIDPDAAYQPRLMCTNCPNRIEPADWGWCTPSQGGAYFCGSTAIALDGNGITPRCPGGLAFRGAIKPESKLKEISPWADRDFQLLVQAKKPGQVTVTSDVINIHVPTDCRLPPCVRAEGFRETPPSIR